MTPSPNFAALLTRFLHNDWFSSYTPAHIRSNHIGTLSTSCCCLPRPHSAGSRRNSP